MAIVDALRVPVTVIAALGSGLIAGVFFAFSSFVMKALAARPASEGIAAMQSINITVLNPWFLGTFVGTAAACAVAAVCALLRGGSPSARFALAGAALYVVGTFLVTMLCNVPKNNALAAVAPADPASAAVWGNYLVTWTAWNHVRMAAALAAAGSFTLALRS